MSNTEFYVTQHASAADTNSGSSAAGPAYTATNGGWNSGTGVFTPASGNPSLTVNVGDWAAVYTDGAGSTSFIGRVTAVSTTTITVSITAKTGTVPTTAASGISCKVGGAWATITRGELLTSVASLNAASDPPRCNVKIEGGTPYVEAITFTLAGTQGIQRTFRSFTATPGDEPITSTNRAFVRPASVTNGVFDLNSVGHHVNIIGFDVLTTSSDRCGFDGSAYNFNVINCKADAPRPIVTSGGGAAQVIRCICTNWASSRWAIENTNFGCVSTLYNVCHGGSSSAAGGINTSSGNCSGNLVYDTGGIGISVSNSGDNSSLVSGNTVADCGGDGIKVQSLADGRAIFNNVACNNGGIGLNASLRCDNDVVFSNVVSGNTSGQISSNFNQIGSNDTTTAAFVTSSSTTRKTNGDYRIVTALQATGFPGLLADQSITSKQGYVDPGALQHPDAGGGSAGTVATMS